MNQTVHLQACLAQAARQSLAIERLPQLLDSLESQLQSATGQEAQVGRFLLQSQRYWLRSLEHKPEFESFIEAHEGAWRHLEGIEVRDLPTGYGRWLTHSAKDWMLLAQQMSDAEAKDYPRRAQLQYLIQQDFDRIEALNKRALEESFRLQPAEPVQFKKLWNPEFFLGLFELRLAFVRYYQNQEAFELAEQHLNRAKALRESLFSRFQEANFAYQSSTMKFGTGNPMLFSWFEGHVLRLLGLYHSQWAQQWLHREPFGKKAAFETEAELDNAQKFQQQSKNNFGLDDWRWSKLRYQVQQTPSGWESQAQALSDSLLQESRSRNNKAELIEALRLQARLQLQQKRATEAVKSLEEAIAIIEKIAAETGAGFRQNYGAIYEELAEIHLQAGRDAEAFDLLGRAAQVQQGATRAKRPLAMQREKEAAAAEELELAKSSAGDSAVEEKVLAENQAQFYSTMRKLRTENESFGSRLAIRPVSFSRVQKFLPEKSALIQYFPSPKALYIFVVDKNNFSVHQVPITEKKLSTLVKNLRRQIQEYGARGKSRSDLFAKQLHKFLIAPVEDKIRNKEELVFVPTGNLFYLPFSALAQEKDGALRYLMQDYNLAVVTKSSDLMALSSQASQKGISLLALGNPDGSLPGAELEVKNLNSIFPNMKTASKDRDLLNKLGSANTLHLATHGVVNHREPMETYLVLAGQDRLSLNDISGADLSQLKLVTLSACETAISSEQGDQGEVATLADSFSFAGVNTLVASLWKVSDESTGILMLHFYQNLKSGMSSSKALTAAQRELIKNPRTSHAYHWAPFMVMALGGLALGAAHGTA